jgi:hypothetical protein
MADLQDKHAHEVRLPHRSRRYGVGKEIAGKVYVHRDYADRLGEPATVAAVALPADFAYDIVKYQRILLRNLARHIAHFRKPSALRMPNLCFSAPVILDNASCRMHSS